MSRNWDQLHRQARANKPAFIQRRPRPHGKRWTPKLATVGVKLKPILPPLDLILTIESVPPLFAFWHRNQRGSWSCTKADAPIEWMTRIVHPEAVKEWLSTQHFPYRWNPSTPPAQQGLEPAEDRPAEAYPLHQASAPSGDNTAPSLNNPSPSSAAPAVPPVDGLERNGIRKPRRLIAASENAELPARNIRC